MRRHLILTVVLLVAGTRLARAQAMYPPFPEDRDRSQPVYHASVQHVVSVTQRVLDRRGWTVIRVGREDDARIVWARRYDQVLRITATPVRRNRVTLSVLLQSRTRDGHSNRDRWADAREPRQILSDINARLQS
jgi:hypothetical protein